MPGAQQLKRVHSADTLAWKQDYFTPCMQHNIREEASFSLMTAGSLRAHGALLEGANAAVT